MNPPVYEIEVKGLTEQIMKLNRFDHYAGSHFKDAAEGSVKLLERNWKMIAPVKTNRYRASIAGRVKSVAGANVVAVVGTNVVSDRGFPYPHALEHSMRYHYRTGPRQGQLTFNRVRRVLKRARGSIKKRFNKAVKLIIKDLEV
jgi:hypothetical protein